MTASNNLRADALYRSQLRVHVHDTLGDEASRYDVDGIVAALVEQQAHPSFVTSGEVWDIAARHEYDEHGLTDAALAAAIERSRTGWVAMIRRPDGDTTILSLNLMDPKECAEDVEKRLRDFVKFPEGTRIQILPLVG